MLTTTMTNSTECDSYAYLSVTCQAPLAEVEAWMGVAGEPRSWSIGDAHRNPKLKPRSFTVWSLGSGIEQGMPLDDHLRAIWARLPPLGDALVRRPADWRGWLVCVARFASPNDPVTIAAGHFKMTATYRLDLDCDFYFDDDARDADGNLRFP